MKEGGRIALAPDSAEHGTDGAALRGFQPVAGHAVCSEVVLGDLATGDDIAAGEEFGAALGAGRGEVRLELGAEGGLSLGARPEGLDQFEFERVGELARAKGAGLLGEDGVRGRQGGLGKKRDGALTGGEAACREEGARLTGQPVGLAGQQKGERRLGEGIRGRGTEREIQRLVGGGMVAETGGEEAERLRAKRIRRGGVSHDRGNLLRPGGELVCDEDLDGEGLEGGIGQGEQGVGLAIEDLAAGSLLQRAGPAIDEIELGRLRPLVQHGERLAAQLNGGGGIEREVGDASGVLGGTEPETRVERPALDNLACPCGREEGGEGRQGSRDGRVVVDGASRLLDNAGIGVLQEGANGG